MSEPLTAMQTLVIVFGGLGFFAWALWMDRRNAPAGAPCASPQEQALRAEGVVLFWAGVFLGCGVGFLLAVWV